MDTTITVTAKVQESSMDLETIFQELLAEGRFDRPEEVDEEADWEALSDEPGYFESCFPFLY